MAIACEHPRGPDSARVRATLNACPGKSRSRVCEVIPKSCSGSVLLLNAARVLISSNPVSCLLTKSAVLSKHTRLIRFTKCIWLKASACARIRENHVHCKRRSFSKTQRFVETVVRERGFSGRNLQSKNRRDYWSK